MKNCVICGKNKYVKLFSLSKKDLQKCVNCGLVSTKNFIEPDYKNYHRDGQYVESEKFFKNIFQTRFDIIYKFKKGGKVLDVGASNGVMLDIFLRSGFETYGIEPSSSADQAIKKGHNIKKTTLEKSRFQESYFDVIISNHVLEHIEDPKTFLKVCRRYLKKDGILYIDVPNFGSLSSLLSGKNWKYILPNEHVYHFTKDTLSKLLETNGFKVEDVYTRSGIFEAANPFKYLLDELFALRKNFIFDCLGIPGNTIATLLNMGTSMGIICYEK